MSGKIIWLLAISAVIFASGFYPLFILNLQTPTKNFTTTVDGVKIVYDVKKRSNTAKESPLAILLHGLARAHINR